MARTTYNIVFEDEHYYIYHDGRELHHIRTERKEQGGYTKTFEVYGVDAVCYQSKYHEIPSVYT